MNCYDIKKGIKCIGVMSGTSLDGMDICYAEFGMASGKWEYHIIKAEEEPYPDNIKEALDSAQNMTAFEYARLHSDYGTYLGKRIKAFVERNEAVPEFIACHGQTIFHQPEIGLTTQIGSGAGIAAVSGIDCICDFRTTDVALGGQGAPLVPIGDRYLFGDYDYCLNLGGFSNISFESAGTRLAYDICPVNYVLNHYMRQVGKDYDNDGLTARSGKICKKLLDKLNALPFYAQTGPKSLGREWVEKDVFPIMDSCGLPLNDILCTYCEHVAIQISKSLESIDETKSGSGYGKVLVTGGGAHNGFLMERMAASAPRFELCIPDRLTADFKEALIFAFLGVLYVCDIPNCISSVTGASRDCIGGALYKGSR
jgi:anhydro-N-acetylmuramic acid kinase